MRRDATRGRARRFRRPRRKVCHFCADHIDDINWRAYQRLRKYITDRGKIMPRRQSGVCAKHQRPLAAAIKRAREIALLPYKAD